MSEKIEIPVEQLLYTWFVTPVALIKELYLILGKEKTLKLVRDVVCKTTAEERNLQLKSFAEFLKGGGSELVKRTTVSEDRKVKKNETSFKITKCLWSKVFKSMNASEIGEVLVCESDFPRAKTWSPKLELKRTQTIMGGAPYCDFCYVWNE
jgi:hypothetical protein